MRKWLIRAILLTVFLLIIKYPQNALAFEEPVAGFAVKVEQFETALSDKTDTERYILIYSALFGVDSNLVKAVIGKESSCDPAAYNRNRNGTHDRGLMQINSCNYEWLSEELGITDFYDSRQNIMAGCYILGGLSKKYESVHQVLMAYNMGEKRTRELWRQGVYSSRYSREVMSKYLILTGG